MSVFSTISPDAFKSIGVEAGVLLNTFDPEHPESTTASDIVCAVSSDGFSIDFSYDDTDFGEDIANCPVNTLELMQRRNTRGSISFTCLNITEETLKMALGAADAASGKVTTRDGLKKGDFSTKWIVMDRVDGGYAAVKLNNALATGGMTMKTTKNGKANLSVTLTAHRTFANPDVVPIEFLVAEGTENIV